MDPNAVNYDSSATISDFSCLYLNLNGISPNYAAQGDTIIPVISSNYTISDALLSNSFDTLQINNLETSFDTLTNFFDYTYYTISANSFNITIALVSSLLLGHDMYSSDRWQIYDEAEIVMQHYSPTQGVYDCGEYSFVYEASASRMSSWTSDGTLSFQVRSYGFSSSNSCSGGDYITASLGRSDKLTYWVLEVLIIFI